MCGKGIVTEIQGIHIRICIKKALKRVNVAKHTFRPKDRGIERCACRIGGEYDNTRI